MKIIVTGSLGHISKPLTAELVAKGHSVTVISHTADRKPEIEALGAEAAFGSLLDTAFLKQVLAGADAVYCMTPPNYSAPDQLAYYQESASAYAAAISGSSVKRVVYLSSYGAHLPSGTGYITGSHRSEKILDTLTGVSVTHLRPTFFYYNFFAFIPMIRAAGFIGTVYGGEDWLAMVSPVDIAHAAADELLKPGVTLRVRYVTSEDMTCNQAAAILGAAIGMPQLDWRILPREQVMQGLQSAGMPENAAQNLVEIGMAIHSGALREDFARNMPEHGKVKLTDFAADFAHAYHS